MLHDENCMPETCFVGMRILLSCFTPTLGDVCLGLTSLAIYENKYYLYNEIVAYTALSLLVSEVFNTCTHLEGCGFISWPTWSLYCLFVWYSPIACIYVLMKIPLKYICMIMLACVHMCLYAYIHTYIYTYIHHPVTCCLKLICSSYLNF
jgi:hypothetical protein